MKITPRQVQVLHMKSRGMTERAIASRLGIAIGTVRALRNTAAKRLGVSGRRSAVEAYRAAQ